MPYIPQIKIDPTSPPANELAISLPQGLRVALVHDWLNGMRGGERVLEYFCQLFPKADLFTLIYDRPKVSRLIRSMNVIESGFAQIPKARTHYRLMLPVLPSFIKRLPTAEYDLVISTSHCVAKGAPRPLNGMHLSYVFSPMRYVWDHFHDYLGTNHVKNMGMYALRPWMQRWDRHSCHQVDSFAADSDHIARKIDQFWGRHAVTIHPPVDLDHFIPTNQPPENFFLVVSALVPYKKIDRAILAANEAKAPLVIVGKGPEEERLKAIAGRTVEFVGPVPDQELVGYYQRARALVFPGIEDYGITPLESMACGRPVLALKGGGALETVAEGVTGQFFSDPTPKSLAHLLRNHDDSLYDLQSIRAHAEKFSPNQFRQQLVEWISSTTRFLW